MLKEQSRAKLLLAYRSAPDEPEEVLLVPPPEPSPPVIEDGRGDSAGALVIRGGDQGAGALVRGAAVGRAAGLAATFFGAGGAAIFFGAGLAATFFGAGLAAIFFGAGLAATFLEAGFGAAFMRAAGRLALAGAFFAGFPSLFAAMPAPVRAVDFLALALFAALELGALFLLDFFFAICGVPPGKWVCTIV